MSQKKSLSFSVRIIKRKDGKSTVGKATYIGALAGTDNTNQKYFNFKKKQDQIVFSKTYGPDNSPDWIHEPLIMWNRVEKSHIRRDAQTGREITAALPNEFKKQQQIIVMEEFIETSLVSKGMVGFANIHHNPANLNNPHFHVLLTTRTLDPTTETGFSRLKERTWNNKENLISWRQNWASICNKHLKAAGLDIEINVNSYASNKVLLLPKFHIGPIGSKLKNRDAKSAINKEIEKINILINRANHHMERFRFFQSNPQNLIGELERLLDLIEKQILDNKILNYKKVISFKESIISIISHINQKLDFKMDSKENDSLKYVSAPAA